MQNLATIIEVFAAHLVLALRSFNLSGPIKPWDIEILFTANQHNLLIQEEAKEAEITAFSRISGGETVYRKV